jgi:hypothetical protein
MHLIRIATFQKIQEELAPLGVDPYEVAKKPDEGDCSEECVPEEDTTPKITGRQALIKKLTGKRIRPAILPEAYRKKQRELNLAQATPGEVNVKELFERTSFEQGGTGGSVNTWHLKDRHKQSLQRYRAAVKEAKALDKQSEVSHRLEALEPVSVKELKKRDKVVIKDEVAPTI